MFKCGFYESEITPFLGGTIPGYFRTRVADGVKSKLYAKAAAFSDGNKKMVIITADILATHPELHNAVCKRVIEFTGLDEEQIMFTALHNHTSGTYVEYPEFHTKDEVATEMLIRRSADSAVLALQRLEDVSVWYGCEKAEDIAFIRNYLMKDGSIKTNPGNRNPEILEPVGKPDEDFPFLMFKNGDGKYIGAISSFALHQDTVAGNEYCGEFSGVLSDKLKGLYGAGFVSVFLNGFCGNINHVNTQVDPKTREKPTYVMTGRVLFESMQKGMDNLEEIKNPGIGFCRKVLDVEQRKISKAMLDDAYELMKKDGYDFESLNINNPESEVFRRAKAPRLIEYAKVQNDVLHPDLKVASIGDCVIYFANGECYVEFQHYIKQNSPSNKNMFASNSNGAFYGYMPTKEMYDVKTLYEANLPAAKMVAGTGERISEELVNMAKDLLNK